MRIIYSPTVRVVATSRMHHANLDEFTGRYDHQRLDEHGEQTVTDLDAIPEFAGRVCYHSFGRPRPGGNEAYIEHILQEGHGSVLEHSYVTLLITGVSRSLTHELIRHRAGTAFSELSQRYVEPSDDVGFVMPPLAIGHEEIEIEMKASFKAALDRYRTVLFYTESLAKKDDNYKAITMAKKRAREAARAVLPNATETHIVMSGNLRAWRNICEQRGSLMADLEICRLAQCITATMKQITPSVFMDATPLTTSVSFSYRKV
jgi:thymidylate synthase (FAD)